MHAPCFFLVRLTLSRLSTCSRVWELSIICGPRRQGWRGQQRGRGGDCATRPLGLEVRKGWSSPHPMATSEFARHKLTAARDILTPWKAAAPAHGLRLRAAGCAERTGDQAAGGTAGRPPDCVVGSPLHIYPVPRRRHTHALAIPPSHAAQCFKLNASASQAGE